MTTASKAPVKPIKLEPGHTYLQVTYTSPEPPSTNNDQLQLPSGVQVKYLGPVGELKGVGIYEVVPHPYREGEAENWTRQQKEVERALKDVQGIKGVQIMQPPKLRAKRDEF